MSHLANFRHAWTPEHLDLLAWSDAADTATITHSGGAVSQWNDKSGNGYHVSQANGAYQPTTGSRTIGGLNALDFAIDTLYRGAGPYARNAESILIIAVVDADVITGQRVVTEFFRGGAGNTRCKHQIEDSAWSGAGRRLDSDSYVELDSLLTCTTGVHIFGTLFDYINAQMNWAVDGVLDTPQTFQTAGNTSDIDSNGLFVGGRSADASEAFDGSIGELIYLQDDSITIKARQRIEGYLAWKWGLVANLPAAHPYKNHPPYAGE